MPKPMLHSCQIAAAVEDSVNQCKPSPRLSLNDQTSVTHLPICVLLSLSLAASAVTWAAAQDWPLKTVRIVDPFGAGSTPDIVARLLADGLQQKYPASSFLVENKPGASGNLGTDMVAKATPDGSIIGVSIGGPLAINTLLFAKLPYDPRKDIAPIAQLVTQPSVLAINPSLGVNSVAELVALLAKNPGKYNFASIGNGSLSHLAMEAIAIKGRCPGSTCALHQLASGDHGRHPQRCADGVPSGDRSDTASCIRRSKNSRGFYSQALALFTGRSDIERGRHRRGSGRLEWPDCAGWDAQGHHRENQR